MGSSSGFSSCVEQRVTIPRSLFCEPGSVSEAKDRRTRQSRIKTESRVEFSRSLVPQGRPTLKVEMFFNKKAHHSTYLRLERNDLEKDY